MRVRKGALPLVGIAVLGLITFAVVLAFLSGISRTTEVVVASRGLSAGTRLTAEDVALKRIHASAILEDALTDPAGAEADEALKRVEVADSARLPGVAFHVRAHVAVEPRRRRQRAGVQGGIEPSHHQVVDVGRWPGRRRAG